MKTKVIKMVSSKTRDKLLDLEQKYNCIIVCGLTYRSGKNINYTACFADGRTFGTLTVADMIYFIGKFYRKEI